MDAKPLFWVQNKRWQGYLKRKGTYYFWLCYRLEKIKQYAQPTAEENARCKVCFKKFQDGEFFKLCCSCERKVCDDCSASYGQKNTVSF